MDWYIKVLKKYAVFQGRASRSEYWYFVLFNAIISMSLFGLWRGTGSQLFNVLYILYAVGVFLPTIGVAVRRLHDTDHSGWWLLIDAVPLIGMIVLLVFFVQDSTPLSNQYGQNPKVS